MKSCIVILLALFISCSDGGDNSDSSRFDASLNIRLNDAAGNNLLGSTNYPVNDIAYFYLKNGDLVIPDGNGSTMPYFTSIAQQA